MEVNDSGFRNMVVFAIAIDLTPCLCLGEVLLWLEARMVETEQMA